MPKPTVITTEILDEIARRRAAGQHWKQIKPDLAARGLPTSLSSYHRQGLTVVRYFDVAEPDASAPPLRNTDAVPSRAMTQHNAA